MRSTRNWYLSYLLSVLVTFLSIQPASAQGWCSTEHESGQGCSSIVCVGYCDCIFYDAYMYCYALGGSCYVYNWEKYDGSPSECYFCGESTGWSCDN